MTSSGVVIGGPMVALLTPLDAAGRLDRRGLECLLARVVEGGVVAVCPVGSTGEGPRLAAERRVEIVDAVVGELASTLPVIPASAGRTIEELHSEIQTLADLGARAVLVAPPAYYPLDDDAVLGFYEAIAERSPVPIVLYNIPIFTKVTIEPAIAARLADHPNVAGIKDSSRDLEYFAALVGATRSAPQFAVLTGTDTLLLASLLTGGAGAIAASANLVPELGVGIHQAVAEGAWERAQKLQDRLRQVVLACRAGTVPAGWKAALALVGVCEPHLAAPAAGLGAEAYANLRGRLAALEMI